MNTVSEYLAQPIFARVGWTLVHFLWQGALIAGLYAVAQACLRGQSAQWRYALSCLSLILMALAPALTFYGLPDPPLKSQGALSMMESAKAVSAGTAKPIDFSAALAHANSGPALSTTVTLAQGIEALLPWIVSLWGVGVLLLSLRLLAGWRRVQRLARRHITPMPEFWNDKLRQLKLRLGIQFAIRIAQSALVEVPTVLGWLRPVILFPIGILTGLSTAQVEALLAHELAHIKRRDYLVNIAQSVVEVLLFYHPAVWWISRRIREERELCCDDLAVRISGNRLDYARALAALEEQHGLAPAWAIGARSGSLLARIRRLARQPEPTASQAGFWIGGFVASLMVFGLAAGFWHSASAADSATAVKSEVRSPSETTGSPWQVKLKNGSTVELMAVSQAPMVKNQSWWRPDGSPLFEAPIDVITGGWSSGNNTPARHVALRLNNPADVISYEITPSGGATGSSSGNAYKQGATLKDVLLLSSTLAENQTAATIRLQINNETWRTRLFPSGSGATSAGDYEFLLSPPVTSEGQTLVTLTVTRWPGEYRLLAIGKDGKKYEPARKLSDSTVGKTRQQTMSYGLLPDQLQKFEFQTRESEWIEFKNVQVNPTSGGVKSADSSIRENKQEQPVSSVEKLPNATDTNRQVRVFHLLHADPKEMASALTERFPSRGAGTSDDGNRTEKKDGILAVPDTRTSAVIVSASGNVMPQIADTVRQLDQNSARNQKNTPLLQFRLVATETEEKPYHKLPVIEEPGKTLNVLDQIMLDESSVETAYFMMDQTRPTIGVTLTKTGAEIFFNLTADNIGRRLAVVWDGKVISAPRIVGAIPSGKGVISGNFDPEEAKTIVAWLNLRGKRSTDTGSQEFKIVVMGYVKNAGSHEKPSGENMTVSKAISWAGGFTEMADHQRVRIYHRGSSENFREVDVDAVLNKRASDTELEYQDVVYVPKRKND